MPLHPAHMPALPAEFTFAGFAFPRYLATLPKGSPAQRVGYRRQPQCVGETYHRPTPNANGRGFYLTACEAHGMRYQWADEVIRLGHHGWYTDEYGDGDTARGIVARLPHGRGFLAGWSLGVGMCATLDATIYADETEAARAADEEARIAAEHMRDDDEQWRAEQDAN